MSGVKKLRKKAVSGSRFFRNEGVISFTILALQKIKDRGQHEVGGGHPQKAQIHTKARYEDILAASIGTKVGRKPKKLSKGKPMKFIWIMPPPGKGSGGHLNIFRFIEYMEKAGHECSILIYVDSPEISMEAIKVSMGNSYPKIKALEAMSWLGKDHAVSDDTSGIFATSWETAYASKALDSPAQRFYFVQDFEPYFYPVGGMYSLAENTYKMGFFGITAGGWLAKKLREEYGMQTAAFDFGSDPSTYRHTNHKQRKEVFHYVRPYTERRGFEIGILTLDLFHKMHPDYVINLVGWDVSTYDIPFPHVNTDVMEVSQLSDMYNRCAAGLVLSYTNMSLLPLELLGCGTIPVTNDAENNRLVSNNPFIAYADNNPLALAEKLSEVVSRIDQAGYAEKGSKSVVAASWDKSGKGFVNAVEGVLGYV